MTCAFVPTSGAGMSRYVPSAMSIFCVNPQRQRTKLAATHARRIARYAALCPAERNVDNGRLPRHQRGQ